MFSKIFSPKKENLTKKVEWTFEEIKEAIESKWKDRTCECCGRKNWCLAEDILKHLFYDPRLDDKCYMSVLVFCDHCGNMKNFKARTLLR